MDVYPFTYYEIFYNFAQQENNDLFAVCDDVNSVGKRAVWW
jgi:hypothetical protein